MAISSITGPAFAAVHGIRKVSKVVAASVFVAVVASIKTGIAGGAYLKSEPEIKQMSMMLPSKQLHLLLVSVLSEHFFAALRLAD